MPAAIGGADAVAVAHVKDLQGLAARAEVEPPVGQHAVNIEHQQTDRGGSGGACASAGEAANSLDDARAQQIVDIERADELAAAHP